MAPHERGLLIERVAKALCRHAYPTRSLDEAVSPSVEIWMRMIPEAEIAVREMESSRPEARTIEPWMLDRVIDHLTMSGWFLGDYQNMSVKEVLTKWKDSLPPQNTHEEG